ncbi:hypothetical protein RHSIM_Rhsim09G0156700 [Rhododendron simsii]|uniref:RING-type E3 ubiquitin transferase n=1 Tax=Rhododendron simsii TaxID=118357 RepID=A0A834GIT8_RHOSS|nr:hypothetical protein RHSIM_Rhsim09G0156700 [Rhododendron simsii]
MASMRSERKQCLHSVAPTKVDNHPPHCSYPGFDLSCSPKTTANLLNLPYSVKVLVTNIDYETQSIHIKDPNSCSPQQLQNLNCYHSVHFVYLVASQRNLIFRIVALASIAMFMSCLG